jgi:hypothetical protein
VGVQIHGIILFCRRDVNSELAESTVSSSSQPSKAPCSCPRLPGPGSEPDPGPDPDPAQLQILPSCMFRLTIVCSFLRFISSLQFKNMSGGILSDHVAGCPLDVLLAPNPADQHNHPPDPVPAPVPVPVLFTLHPDPAPTPVPVPALPVYNPQASLPLRYL